MTEVREMMAGRTDGRERGVFVQRWWWGVVQPSMGASGTLAIPK